MLTRLLKWAADYGADYQEGKHNGVGAILTTANRYTRVQQHKNFKMAGKPPTHTKENTFRVLTTISKFQLYYRPEELRLFNYAISVTDIVFQSHAARTMLAKPTK